MNLRMFAMAAVGGIAVSSATHAANLDFNTLPKGTIVEGQLASSGVTITARLNPLLPQSPIIFDSHSRNTPDPDLEGDTWSKGNLAPVTNLDNFLVLPQNVIDKNGDGRVDNPDDNGDQPAGSIIFDFGTRLTSLGFDLVDIDGPKEFSSTAGYVAFFSGNTELKRVGWGELINPSSPFYDPTIKYADHSANRVQPFTTVSLGIGTFDRVEFNLNGSGAIDNVNFKEVPEPATGIAVLGLAAGLLRRRRA